MTIELFKEMILFVGSYVVLFAVFAIYIKIKEKKHAEISKTEFAYIICHQLLTPLTTMRWTIDGLLSSKEKPSLKCLTQVKKIQDNNGRMIQLVDMLLKISKLEAQKLEINLEPTDLSKLAKQVIDEFQLHFKKKRLKVKLITAKSLPLVKVDPSLMKEVYVNLINNAIKFSPLGGLIEVRHECKDGQIFISVKDQGPGISLESQKKLFEKFGSGSVHGKKHAGTGLGLYFTKLIVEAFKGTISCQSKANKGSVFTITIGL